MIKKRRNYIDNICGARRYWAYMPFLTVAAVTFSGGEEKSAFTLRCLP
jgi:hypothetical protein